MGRQNQLRAIIARLALLVPNDKLDCFVLVEYFALNKNNSTFLPLPIQLPKTIYWFSIPSSSLDNSTSHYFSAFKTKSFHKAAIFGVQSASSLPAK